MVLIEAVDAAVEWAFDGSSGRGKALAALARELAKQIDDPSDVDHPVPTAALSKELRATLEELEGLRDGDDAQAGLAAVLSSPVWDAAQS